MQPLVKTHRHIAALAAAVFLLLVADGAAAGRIVCWTNDDGVRECGNAIPPEYVDKRREELNERGMVVNVTPEAKTKEELAEEARLAKLAEEQRKRDDILLKTFTTERDILIARDRKVAAIESTIGITTTNVASLQQDLEEEQRRAANYERRGKAVPDELLQEMATTKRSIADKEAYIAQKRHEQDSIRAQYDADLARFRELTAQRR